MSSVPCALLKVTRAAFYAWLATSRLGWRRDEGAVHEDSKGTYGSLRGPRRAQARGRR